MTQQGSSAATPDAPDERRLAVNADVTKTTPEPTSETTVAPVYLETGGAPVVTSTVAVSGDFVARDKFVIIQRLTPEEIQSHIETLRRLDQPKTWDGRPPFVGMKSFQEEDAEFFFGRESLVTELVEHLRRSRFVCVAGPSGSGKSSLIRAGLLPALRQGQIEGSRRWIYVLCSPRSRPIEELELALARANPEKAAAVHTKKIQQLELALAQQHAQNVKAVSGENKNQAKESPLHRQIDFLFYHIELLLSDDRDQKCVIVVDQFEELFTQTSDNAQRMAFVQLLTEIADRPDGRAIVILTLRSDFVSPCADYPRLRVLINQQFQLVGAMEPEELLRAIVMPVLKVGAAIEPELVSHIVSDMRGEPGALPLMQFALNEMFAATTPQKGHAVSLTIDDYTRKGGIYGILERQADAALSRLAPEQLSIARHIFSSVVEVGRDAPDARRIVPFGELVPVNVSAHAVEAVLEGLSAADARLIIAGIPGPADAAQPSTFDRFEVKWQNVTIAHEKLIVAWPWLARLVDENREWLRHQQRIDEARRAWQQSKNASDLLRGRQLESAAVWAKQNPHGVTKEQETFLEISRMTERWRKWTGVGLRLFFVLLFAPVPIILTNAWIENLRWQSNWQPIQAFPSQAVTSVTVATSAERDTAQNCFTASRVCVGTNNIGVACMRDGGGWNIYQSGLPIGTTPWFTSRETLWGLLIGRAWAGRMHAVYNIQYDRKDQSKLYAFLGDKGLYRSTDGGANWSKVKSGSAPPTFPREGASKIDVYGDYILVASAWANATNINTRLLVSSNSGESWTTIGVGDHDPGAINDFSLAVSQTDDPLEVYFVSTTGLFRAREVDDWTSELLIRAPGNSELIWIAHNEATDDYYLAGYNTSENWTELYRWPSEASQLEWLGGRTGAVQALAVNPGRSVPGVVWLLFESGEIVALDENGAFTSYGSRAGWPWAQAYAIWFARVTGSTVGDFVPYVSHSDGILQCQGCFNSG